MSTKTKNTTKTSEQLARATQQLGLILMTAAFTLSMVEIPEHAKKVVLPSQQAFAFAHNPAEGGHGNDNALRREREETGPHYVSYSNAQRTPSRTGKV